MENDVSEAQYAESLKGIGKGFGLQFLDDEELLKGFIGMEGQ